MTKKIAGTFIYLLFFLAGLSQKKVQGIVLDAEKGTPVPNASVFLNNTSVGTTAGSDGKFSLSLPAGRFELIVTSIGYATHNQSINEENATDFFTIKMQLKAPELETIIIEPFEKEGWQKWGRWFTDNFIGTSEYAQDCRLKNPEVLRFRNSKQRNELTAIAIAPLLIENKALGYTITYQLENFRYDFKSRYLLYAGYPFFKNLPGSDRKLRKWAAAREETYYGSMLHFMRAMFRNKLIQEGFEVRRLQKLLNAEKERIRSVYKSNLKMDNNGRPVSTINNDSSTYYNHIMSQDDYTNKIGAAIAGDSVAYAADSVTAGLDFEDYLLVIYRAKKVPFAYKQLFPKSADEMMSEITLINGRPLTIASNGAYFAPDDLLASGYWGWWEKMGTMLPFDYKPQKN